MTTLREWAVGILATADPEIKCAETDKAAAAWRSGALALGHASPPDTPARPDKPVLVDPRQMPRRSMGPKGRVAMVHALAHIELYAVDLAWDIIARFADDALPRAFIDDWTAVAVEEAMHFRALRERLRQMDAAYGDLPAHSGLWDAAARTHDDLMARLALIPMTLEARGLDTTPAIAQRLRQANDHDTAAILDMIYTDEIKHLAVGIRWFGFLSAQTGQDPRTAYHDILAVRFPSGPKAPFNLEARAAAGMDAGYLRPWLPA